MTHQFRKNGAFYTNMAACEKFFGLSKKQA